MTEAEARANQDRIEKRYGSKGLAWWYGTGCRKCCGVYPKFMTADIQNPENNYYQCEVCGKRTKKMHSMPWLAERAWNNGEVTEPQMNIFQFL